MPQPEKKTRAARSRARRTCMQALYQMLLTDQRPADIGEQFRVSGQLEGADETLFLTLLREVEGRRIEFDAVIGRFADRPVGQIDPVEHAVLYVALAEFSACPAVPYKVVIDEAIGMARRFGGTDGHRYVNAILDRAARELRADETGS